jgi:hypothetical protein
MILQAYVRIAKEAQTRDRGDDARKITTEIKSYFDPLPVCMVSFSSVEITSGGQTYPRICMASSLRHLCFLSHVCTLVSFVLILNLLIA